MVVAQFVMRVWSDKTHSGYLFSMAPGRLRGVPHLGRGKQDMPRKFESANIICRNLNGSDRISGKIIDRPKFDNGAHIIFADQIST